jgi:hypothetical protein
MIAAALSGVHKLYLILISVKNDSPEAALTKELGVQLLKLDEVLLGVLDLPKLIAPTPMA